MSLFSLVINLLTTAVAATPQDAPVVARPPVSPREVFDLDRAHAIHLKLSSDAWNLIQPGAPGGRAVPGATREQGKAAGVRARAAGPGYAYVPVEMEFDGQRLADVGARMKGNSSYAVSAATRRRPMKVDFNRFVEGGRFAGVESLNLSNTTFDASGAREAVAFWMYRKLGVPAPRTGHALVYLSVAGAHDREYLGLYTLIEEIDEHFLRRWFANDDGLLCKPSGMRGLAYLGDKWADYQGICAPRGPVRPELAAKIVELARLTHRADDAEFRAKVKSCLAVDAFLRFVAATSLVINFDSFLSTGHNYFIYVNPADGLIYFIPWDVNMTFGVYGWPGTDDELARTSITRAYADHNILIERVLAIDEYAFAYREHVRQLAAATCTPAKLRERRERMAPVFAAADVAAREAGRVGSPTTRPAVGMGLSPPDFWAFANRRAESIRLQLTGKEPGFKPEFRDPRRTLVEWAPLTVAAVTFMKTTDADGDWRLSDAEVAAVSARLLKAAGVATDGMIDRPTAVSTFDKVMPDDLKRRVPPAAWAEWLIKTADADGNGKVNAAEMLAAYKRFQQPYDADRDGRMDNREMVEAMGAASTPRDPDPGR